MAKILPIWILVFLIFSCNGKEKKPVKTGQSHAVTTLEAEVGQFIPGLPDTLNEISGLMTYRDLFWGFNDSGGKNVLYAFDRSGIIQMEIEISDATNVDWESITQNRKYIFVGDFGNNPGNRKDLLVYRIKKSDIGDGKQQKVEAKTLRFSYSGQDDFSYNMQKTPYDCEAMVELNGQLHLFSKNWKDRTTEHYIMPAINGEYSLPVISSYDVKGLITGADISPDKTTLALVGYENFKSFVWLFTGFQNDDFFSARSKRIDITNLNGSQTEGICFLGIDSVLISTEGTMNFRQQVFLLDLKKLEDGTSQGK